MVRDAFGRAVSPWAQLARTHCSECGSPVVWVNDLDQLRRLVKPEERSRVDEGIDFAGVDCDAWICASRDCRAFGLFVGDSVFFA
jgi:hypothetical protein